MVTLTITNLYSKDNTIFDNLQLPENVDRAQTINTILFNCADLEILYPDTTLIKNLIGIWSKTEVDKWERFNRAVNTEYNPLENYDRIEEWTEHNEGTSGQSTTSTASGDNTNTDKVSAFNSTTFENRAQSTGTNSNTASGSASGEADSDTTHNGRIHGNIGVTTAQQMLKAEIEILDDICIFDYIANSFKNRFCLQIY